MAHRPRRTVALCALLALAATLAACVGPQGGGPNQDGSATGSPTAAAPSRPPAPPQLPLGGRTIFPQYRLVAFYGTAGTSGLGVLGEQPPAETLQRLREVAAGYDTPNRTVQPTFELIVTIADAAPGGDGDYSHAIDRADVRRYVDFARRNDVMVVLDIQPGRGNFLPAVTYWEEFLKQPHVGVALDSEWRMRPDQIPAQTVGQVEASEVNRVADYVAGLVRRNNLPQKAFLLHTFRDDMLLDEQRIRQHPELAMVQHLDGFGDRKLKIRKYRDLQRPRKFHMGFKLFYDEDTDLFRPDEVLRQLNPPPEFISYQ